MSDLPPSEQPPSVLPPAGWYTDPEDGSKYRYWNGQEWTDHRAPRTLEQDASTPALPVTADTYDDLVDSDGGQVIPPGRLVGTSLKTSLRCWKTILLGTAVAVVGEAVLVFFGYISLNRITDSRLGEIFDFIGADGFDVESQETEDFFNSIDWDWSLLNFASIALGLLVAWIAYNVMRVTIMHATLNHLLAQRRSAREVLGGSFARLPRVMGLDIQVALLLIGATLVVVMSGFLSPVLMLVTVPAWTVAMFYFVVLTTIAYPVAATGPGVSSLPYVASLIRKRYWKTFGRLLLVWLTVIGILTLVAIIFGVGAELSGPVAWLFDIAQAVAALVIGAVPLAGSVILYHSLGGESEDLQEH